MRELGRGYRGQVSQECPYLSEAETSSFPWLFCALLLGRGPCAVGGGQGGMFEAPLGPAVPAGWAVSAWAGSAGGPSQQLSRKKQ